MATRTQYETLKAVYDDEMARYADLRNTGKVYLTLCTFFLGGLGFKLGTVFAQSGLVTQLVFLLALAAFLLSFLLILRALGIYAYEGLTDPAAVVEGFGDAPPGDDEFLDDRIIDIAAACSTNVKADDTRARFLEAASWAMFAGLILGFTSLVLVSTAPDLGGF